EATADTGAAPAPPPAEQTPEPVIPDEVPALTSGGSVLYPGIVVPYVSVERSDVDAINEAVATPSRAVGIFPQELDAEGNPTGGPRAMGTVATVLRMARGQQGGVQAILQGVQRVRLLQLLQDKPYLRARIEPVPDSVEPSPELEALLRNVLQLT